MNYQRYTPKEDMEIRAAVSVAPKGGKDAALRSLAYRYGRTLGAVRTRARCLVLCNPIEEEVRRRRRSVGKRRHELKPQPKLRAVLPVAAPLWMKPLTRARLMAGR